MAEARWFRLDSNEELRDWKMNMQLAQRYAWLCLLQYVAATAPNQKRPGVAPAMPLVAFARAYDIPLLDVEVMLSHAQAAGQLVIDEGEWDVRNKAHYVSERTLREKPQPGVEAGGPREPASEVLPENMAEHGKTRKKAEEGGRRRRNAEALSRDTHTHTHITEASASDGDPPSAGGLVVPEEPEERPPELAEPPMTPYARVERVMTACHRHRGYPAPPGPQDVRRELRTGTTSLASLLDWLDGPEGAAHEDQRRWLTTQRGAPCSLSDLPSDAERTAVAMWARASQRWRSEGDPPWSWVYANRQALLAPAALPRDMAPANRPSLQQEADAMLAEMRGTR